MIITQFRTYHQDFTESELFINGGKRYCYALEDVGRPANVKIPAETCIPEGHYSVVINYSTRFNRYMLLMFNQKDHSVTQSGIRFTGIRAHGVNDVGDTAGCVGLAFKTDHLGKVWDKASDDLFRLVKKFIDQGERIDWIITQQNSTT